MWTANYHYTLTLMQLGKAREVIGTGRKILPVTEKLHGANPTEARKFYKRSLEVWKILEKNDTIKKSDIPKMEEVTSRL